MSPGARRWWWGFRNWFRTNSGLLLILGGTILSRGVSYLPDLHSTHPLDELLTSPVMAWVWVIVGGYTILSAFLPAGWAQSLGAALSVGLLTVWAVAGLTSPEVWLAQRGGVYAGMAALTVYCLWRGHRGEVTLYGRVAD